MDIRKRQKLLRAMMLFKTVTYKFSSAIEVTGKIIGFRNSLEEGILVKFLSGSETKWVPADKIAI